MENIILKINGNEASESSIVALSTKLIEEGGEISHILIPKRNEKLNTNDFILEISIDSLKDLMMYLEYEDEDQLLKRILIKNGYSLSYKDGYSLWKDGKKIKSKNMTDPMIFKHLSKFCTDDSSHTLKPLMSDIEKITEGLDNIDPMILKTVPIFSKYAFDDLELKSAILKLTNDMEASEEPCLYSTHSFDEIKCKACKYKELCDIIGPRGKI